jgi:hypothetical protein
VLGPRPHLTSAPGPVRNGDQRGLGRTDQLRLGVGASMKGGVQERSRVLPGRRALSATGVGVHNDRGRHGSPGNHQGHRGVGLRVHDGKMASA